MPGILDLPNEILSLIWRDLPLPALISTRFVSRHIYESSLPYLHYAFQKKSTPEHTRGELRRFWEFIKNDPSVRPQVRSIIVDDMCGDLSIRTLRSLTVPLLSFTPRLRKLAIPGHHKLLSSLHTSIQKGKTSLTCLQELRCVECDPIIWEILGDLPQLCLLSLTHLRLDQSILELPVASLSIQAIFFEDCDLDSKGICAVIKSCKRLTNFQYLCSSPKRLLFGDPEKSYLDVGDIHEALLHHKNSLEELVIQDYDDGKPYDQIPKFRSFEDFTSLTRLGVDYYNIDWHLPFPPALDSVAVRQCWIGESDLSVVLGYLGKHPYLKAISVDHAVACVFFQQSRLVRKDIRLHFPARYHPSFGEFSNVVAHPLPWIGPSEHFLI